MFRNFLHNGKQYTFIKVLGQGGFGKVYLYNLDGRFVTLKLFYTTVTNKSRIIRDYNHEVNNLEYIKKSLGDKCYPTIACFYDTIVISQTENPELYSSFYNNIQSTVQAKLQPMPFYGILTRYVEGPSLDIFILESRKKGYTYAQIPAMRKLITQMLQTLDILYQLNIAHRDIKPQNIIYEVTTGNFVLIDFGIACYKQCKDIQFTPGYVSVDLLRKYAYNAPISFKEFLNSDVFSTGVTVYGFATLGKYPFSQTINKQFHNPALFYPLKTPDTEVNTIVNNMLINYNYGLPKFLQYWFST